MSRFATGFYDVQNARTETGRGLQKQGMTFSVSLLVAVVGTCFLLVAWYHRLTNW